MASRSFAGKGKVYLKNISQPGSKRLCIGNVSKLDIAISEDVHEQKDYMSAGGGIAASFSRISKVEAQFTMHDFSEANMALATRGKFASEVAGSVVNETVTADLDALVMLDFADAKTVVVKDVAGATTFVEGVDYLVSGAGITPLGTGAIAEGEALHVSYSHGGQSSIEALVSGQDEYEVVFEGLNEADDEKACVVRLYRNKFSPAKNLSFIADDFGVLDLTATVMKSKNVGDGKKTSSFFKVTYAA